VNDNFVKYEPFFVHEVAHLYESLKDFELTVNDSQDYGHAKFDFEAMKLFKNLKRMKLKGTQICGESVGDMVNFLQENQKEAVLELGSRLLYAISSSGWVKETIKKISEVKRLDRRLRVKVDLSLKGYDLAILVKELCGIMKFIKRRKDIIVCLTLDGKEEDLMLIEKEILQKDSEIKNLVIVAKDQKIRKRSFIQLRKIEIF